MKKLIWGIAALLSSLATVAPAASVGLTFAGDFGNRYLYGPQGSSLNTFLGCQPDCSWQLDLILPDIAGSQFNSESATLKLNDTAYSISGAMNARYYSDFDSDIMTFSGRSSLLSAPGVVGQEYLYFQMTFLMPLGTLLQSRETPPTDPDIYLNRLLPGSFAIASLINFPGNASGESGVRLETFDSINGPPSYPITGFSATGPFAAANVPEPASWAMLIGGFAIAGAALRRRKTLARVSFAK